MKNSNRKQQIKCQWHDDRFIGCKKKATRYFSMEFKYKTGPVAGEYGLIEMRLCQRHYELVQDRAAKKRREEAWA